MTFFAISVFAELVGFVLYAFVFPKLQAVKRFRISAQEQGALTVKDDLAAAGLPADHVRITSLHQQGDNEHTFHAIRDLLKYENPNRCPCAQDDEVAKPPTRLTVWQLAVRNWDYLVDQIVIYTVSLSIFPGFLYEDTGNHELGTW